MIIRIAALLLALAGTTVQAGQQEPLFEYQGKQFFAAYGMPISPGEIAFSVDEAVAAPEVAGKGGNDDQLDLASPTLGVGRPRHERAPSSVSVAKRPGWWGCRRGRLPRAATPSWSASQKRRLPLGEVPKKDELWLAMKESVPTSML